ncbi:MAG: CocE/NonD family hydrolase [Bacteroidetes bacterium]|nr:CocE/NonD family hydrolase [Bacteroidota bacterium]
MNRTVTSLILIGLLVLTLPGYTQVLSPNVDSILMRDGKKIAADIYLPDTVNTWPTILIQTPYNRLLYRFGLPLGVGLDLDSSKYAYVIIDWRCFYGSINACVASPQRGEDGFDIIDWIALQSWSDGKVGTWGASALGKIQYKTAKEKPPALVCCVPLVAGSQFDYLEYFPGGAARTAYIEQLDALGFGLSSILYANPHYNLLWQITEAAAMYPVDIEVPNLMIGGWYDHNVELMMELFEELRTNSPAKNDHRLLMGPWVHGGTGVAYVGSSVQGELNYPAAAGWSDSLALVFFDYWLRSQSNGWGSSPIIQYFQMGEDQWDNTPSWPPAGTNMENFYLHSDGSMHTGTHTNGTDSLTFTYNPNNPSPTHGGPTLNQALNQGPYDQSNTVESRNDILIFTTPIQNQDVILKGKPEIQLFVGADMLDTDFAVRLTDVYPDGRSMLLADDIFRMRFRLGYTVNDTTHMNSGVVYEINLTLPDIAHTFVQGHSIRLDITGSNYPRFNRNMNTGGEMYPGGSGDSLINPNVANNIVYLNNFYPSRLKLPLDGYFSIEDPSIPPDYLDLQIYPNPSGADFTVRFFNNQRGVVKIEILSFDGRTLVVLHNQMTEAGWSSLKFTRGSIPWYSGLVRLTRGNFTITERLIRLD